MWLRHAAARRCQVPITASGRDLSLEICDDGEGMPEGWRAGVGITAMRERVAELGGGLAVEAPARAEPASRPGYQSTGNDEPRSETQRPGAGAHRG